MKTVILDCWHDQESPNHLQLISKIDRTRYFPNNLNPPTHFIEVWRDNLSTKPYGLREIEDLQFDIDATKAFGATTIAIFKIRPRH